MSFKLLSVRVCLKEKHSCSQYYNTKLSFGFDKLFKYDQVWTKKIRSHLVNYFWNKQSISPQGPCERNCLVLSKCKACSGLHQRLEYGTIKKFLFTQTIHVTGVRNVCDIYSKSIVQPGSARGTAPWCNQGVGIQPWCNKVVVYMNIIMIQVYEIYAKNRH